VQEPAVVVLVPEPVVVPEPVEQVARARAARGLAVLVRPVAQGRVAAVPVVVPEPAVQVARARAAQGRVVLLAAQRAALARAREPVLGLLVPGPAAASVWAAA
jgi:hypothetical protein